MDMAGNEAVAESKTIEEDSEKDLMKDWREGRMVRGVGPYFDGCSLVGLEALV